MRTNILLNDTNDVQKNHDSIDKQQLRRQLAEPIRTFNVLYGTSIMTLKERERESSQYSHDNVLKDNRKNGIYYVLRYDIP